MNGKERIRRAMRHEPVDRVPVMCQLSIGHYLLNTDVTPVELWFTSEGFGRALIALAARYGLTVVEDACQAHGAEYKRRKVGSFGIGCFSFYPTKNMTTGEGGMITTDDPEIARKARLARQHGQSQRYVHDELGYNFRMTDAQAAVGLAQLAKLEGFNARRIALASTSSRHSPLPRSNQGEAGWSSRRMNHSQECWPQIPLAGPFP